VHASGQKPSKPVSQPACAIREIDPSSAAEIEYVARGMRRTLIEVEGEQAGTALYTMDSLQDRVRWHLDPANCTGKVFLAEDSGGRAVGHSIVRIELGDGGRRYGLFSTTYVEPASRKHAVATALLAHGERWMAGHELPEAATWTSATNDKLINLYRKHGYAISAHYTHDATGTPMVRLTKPLVGAS